jgi:hypothetical protein
MLKTEIYRVHDGQMPIRRSLEILFCLNAFDVPLFALMATCSKAYTNKKRAGPFQAR